jgi:hypothetical protein
MDARHYRVAGRQFLHFERKPPTGDRQTANGKAAAKQAADKVRRGLLKMTARYPKRNRRTFIGAIASLTPRIVAIEGARTIRTSTTSRKS